MGFLGTWGIGWAETVVILELMIRTIMSGYRMQEQIILADMYKSVHRSSFGRVFRFCETESSGYSRFVIQASQLCPLGHLGTPDLIPPASYLHTQETSFNTRRKEDPSK
jgi:hypothetical protein